MATAKKVETITHKKKPAAKSNIKLVEQQDMDSARFKMVSEAAYYRAEKRNFEDGDANQDWLEAERDIINLLNRKQD